MRLPGYVFWCGVLSTSMGVMLLIASDRIEGLTLIASLITVLGLVLIGLCLYWSRRDASRGL
jgi:hypothetical protein